MLETREILFLIWCIMLKVTLWGPLAAAGSVLLGPLRATTMDGALS